MTKKATAKRSPQQTAEAAKPNWKVVALTESEDTKKGDEGSIADATVPELETQRSKYTSRAKGVAQIIPDNPGHSHTKDLVIVLMEPKTATDSHVGRKAVLVEDDQVIGEQG